MIIHRFPDGSEGYYYEDGDTGYLGEDAYGGFSGRTLIPKGTFGGVYHNHRKETPSTISWVHLRSKTQMSHNCLACDIEPSMETRHNATVVLVNNDGKPYLDVYLEDL